jgi:hypothetical protein
MTLSTKAAMRKDAIGALHPMQHRHFANIASIILNLKGSMSADDVQLVAEHFAAELRCTNPRFDETRFLKACGI